MKRMKFAVLGLMLVAMSVAALAVWKREPGPVVVRYQFSEVGVLKALEKEVQAKYPGVPIGEDVKLIWHGESTVPNGTLLDFVCEKRSARTNVGIFELVVTTH